MPLALEVTDGENKGLVFIVFAGRVIGRKKADYILKDVNVSSSHAQIVKDGRGIYSLVDLESSNGLQINGQTVKKIALMPGAVFSIGSTQFRVKNLSEKEAAPYLPQRDWKTVISDNISDNPLDTVAMGLFHVFEPMIELEFTEGIQADAKWALSWGPRRAGFGHIDLNLKDADFPDFAFEISAAPEGFLITGTGKKDVLLNGKPFTESPLKDTDVITCGQSIIKINFLEP